MGGPKRRTILLLRGWKRGVSEGERGWEESGREEVPFESFRQPVRIAFYFKDLDCAV